MTRLSKLSVRFWQLSKPKCGRQRYSFKPFVCNSIYAYHVESVGFNREQLFSCTVRARDPSGPKQHKIIIYISTARGDSQENENEHKTRTYHYTKKRAKGGREEAKTSWGPSPSMHEAKASSADKTNNGRESEWERSGKIIFLLNLVITWYEPTKSRGGNNGRGGKILLTNEVNKSQCRASNVVCLVGKQKEFLPRGPLCRWERNL